MSSNLWEISSQGIEEAHPGQKEEEVNPGRTDVVVPELLWFQKQVGAANMFEVVEDHDANDWKAKHAAPIAAEVSPANCKFVRIH